MKELKYGKTYRHNFPQYVIMAFIFMFFLALIIITISQLKNDPEMAWVPAVVFIPIIGAFSLFLFFYRKMRIETFKDRIVIYCRSFKGLTFRNSYKYGFTIRYTDIQSIDLMPIKTFGLLLTHQINIKMNNNEIIYINQFSNLDVLCVEMRQILIYSRRHPSEFIPSKEQLNNENIHNQEKTSEKK